MLVIENLYKKLGEFRLRDINFKISEGEYFVILGPTGTGKTVILETIAGMYKPDNGNIYLDGKNFKNIPPQNRKIGFVYQDYGLFPHLNVKENIVFGLKVRKVSTKKIEQKLQKIVSMFKIEHLLSRYPATLSGGEQQRVAIARALITEPRILLMDEPFNALDPSTKSKFQSMIKKIHSTIQTTTIHITHDFNEALYLANRIAIMKDGKIVQIGTPQEIFKNPKSTFVANFIGIENIFKGEIIDNRIKVASNVIIKVNTNKIGEVNLAIRPEDVLISKKISNANCSNKFYGKIKNIIYQGTLCKINVDIGISLTSIMTTKAFGDMDFKIGDVVKVAIEDYGIHVF